MTGGPTSAGARERRQARFGLAAVIVLLAVSIPVALSRGDDPNDRRSDVAVSEGSTTTVPSTTVPTVVAAAEPEASTPTLPGLAEVAPTTVSPRPTPSTTSLRPPTAPTAPPAPTAAPLQPRCGPAQIAVTATADPARLAAGSPVTVTSTASNRSAALCFYSGYTVRSTFTDSAGRVMRDLVAHADSLGEVVLLPGQALGDQAGWAGTACADDPPGKYCIIAPMGVYTVTVRWSFEIPVEEASANFELV